MRFQNLLPLFLSAILLMPGLTGCKQEDGVNPDDFGPVEWFPPISSNPIGNGLEATAPKFYDACRLEFNVRAYHDQVETAVAELADSDSEKISIDFKEGKMAIQGEQNYLINIQIPIGSDSIGQPAPAIETILGFAIDQHGKWVRTGNPECDVNPEYYLPFTERRPF